AVVAESPGVHRPSWSIENVAQRLVDICDLAEPLVFPVVPDGHGEHLRYSFEMATRSKGLPDA
ncbi:short-chain dehydrogenase, partial [Mycobacterium kansasii]